MGTITSRDFLILLFIFELGVAARRHLLWQFWPDKTLRAAQRVLSRLYHRGLIDRMTIHYPRTKKPRSEPIYWLTWEGILLVAESKGVKGVDRPKNEGENQMRILERKLRDAGIHWVRTPPSAAKLEHDAFIFDFRLLVEQAAEELPAVTVDWINESVFRSPRMDKVKFTIEDQDGQRVENEQGVCPDGFALIEDYKRKEQGLPYKLHLPVEIDMGTHPVRSRFATHKAAPYAAYIGSPAYRVRFGTDAGDWLIVTSGKRRMKNLMRQTDQTAGAGAGRFHFTYWNLLGEGNVLTTPIWYKVGKDEPIALLD